MSATIDFTKIVIGLLGTCVTLFSVSFSLAIYIWRQHIKDNNRQYDDIRKWLEELKEENHETHEKIHERISSGMDALRKENNEGHEKIHERINTIYKRGRW